MVMAQDRDHGHPRDGILQFVLLLTTILLPGHIFLKLQSHTGNMLVYIGTKGQAMEI